MSAHEYESGRVIDSLARERDEARDRIERALTALRDPRATDCERVQAAGLILSEGQEP